MSKANRYSTLMVGLGLAAFAMTAFVPTAAVMPLIGAGGLLVGLAVKRRGEGQ